MSEKRELMVEIGDNLAAAIFLSAIVLAFGLCGVG